MDKSSLLFYSEYQKFYAMTADSAAFRDFCIDAFDADFSQDGFSDRAQVDMILPYIPKGDDVHILDIGCGNGKMAGYLQKKTGAFIHGFDYSEEAIAAARKLQPCRSDFRVGVIGKIDYQPLSFDVIISMDTMYFAPDMTAFMRQIRSWLRPGGVFFAAYQEGDVTPKTEGPNASIPARAMRANGMKYTVTDITRQTYELLRRKREAAERHCAAFEAEGNEMWYEMLIGQTECAMGGFDSFSRSMARYIYVAEIGTE